MSSDPDKDGEEEPSFHLELPAQLQDGASSSVPEAFSTADKLHSWEAEEAPLHGMQHIWFAENAGIIKRKKYFQCASCRLRVEASALDGEREYGSCRPTLTDCRQPVVGKAQSYTIHHWVAGSYERGKICDFCAKQLGTRAKTTKKKGYRCAWCKRVLHTHCLQAKKDAWSTCDLGTFKNIILGSGDIVLLPRRERKKSITLDDMALRLQISPTKTHNRRHSLASLTDDDSPIHKSQSMGILSDAAPAFSQGRTRSIATTVCHESEEEILSMSYRSSSGSIALDGNEDGALGDVDVDVDVDVDADGTQAHKGDASLTSATLNHSKANNGALDGSVTPTHTQRTASIDEECEMGELPSDVNQAVRLMSEEQRAELRASFHEAKQFRDFAVENATSMHARARQYDVADLAFSIESRRKSCHPLLVFVNPKSGGNQGLKLMHQLVYYLNPRQVFNIMARDDSGKVIGPAPALKLFKDTPNVRILVCGGDGTVGWVLEQLDKCGMAHLDIPVGTIPLGTGNDMARSLKMGGGYEGEPVKKVLDSVMECVSTKLDRWLLTYEPMEGFDIEAAQDELNMSVATELPLRGMNNYFSFGSDAFTALSFHNAREKDPSKFNSRMHNKAFYGISAAKDIWKHRYKNLTSMIRLKCDGEDLTEVVARKRLEAIIFLNISSYAAGTKPWGTKFAVDSFSPPRMDDKQIEVIGFQSTLAMAKGVMRVGHGVRITQCSTAEIEFLRPVPIQVDGEPCMLAPGIVTVKFKNQATMLCRPKGRFMRDLLEGRTSPCFPIHANVHIADDDEDDDDDDDTDSIASSRASPANVPGGRRSLPSSLGSSPRVGRRRRPESTSSGANGAFARTRQTVSTLSPQHARADFSADRRQASTGNQPKQRRATFTNSLSSSVDGQRAGRRPVSPTLAQPSSPLGSRAATKRSSLNPTHDGTSRTAARSSLFQPSTSLISSPASTRDPSRPHSSGSFQSRNADNAFDSPPGSPASPSPNTTRRMHIKAMEAASRVSESRAQMSTHSSSSQNSSRVPHHAGMNLRPSSAQSSRRPDASSAQGVMRRTRDSTDSTLSLSRPGTSALEFDTSVPLYLVPSMTCQRRGPLRFMGTIFVDNSFSLFRCREAISSSFQLRFSRRDGWRFLQFKQHEGEDDGIFKVLNKSMEKTVIVEDFMRNTIKRGLFICNMAENTAATSVFTLVASDDLAQFQYNVENGAIDVATTDKTLFTVLHQAALCDASRILEYVIASAALKTNITDICGRTPLHYAAQLGHKRACQILLQHGADTAIRDCGHYRPMDLAVAEGFDDIAVLVAADDNSESFA